MTERIGQVLAALRARAQRAPVFLDSFTKRNLPTVKLKIHVRRKSGKDPTLGKEANH
jgi:hypothetical protein